MLEVREVFKSYASTRAVGGVSFTAKPGEIFGLIGPNGAGKSTTIRMIMNIIAPDSGEILVAGRRLGEDDKSRIGYLPEERGLYRKVRVGDMLRYLADLKGADRSRSERAIDDWLARFDLGGWKGRKVEELSRGMAQKVQFIGSVVHDPELLLFDEPFSGLDPVSQDLLLEVLLSLKAAGKTILFSTHIMEQAEKLCDRIFLMDKGREIASGSLAEVKAGHGRETVHLEFDGDAAFVKNLAFVEKVIAWPRSLEAELRAGTDPDELYRALAGRVRVRRFEVMAPSLHSVFVRLVGRPGNGLEPQKEGPDA